ncbi:MAG: glycosyltransferase family 4 protein [Clostridia bacterium]|nr:glycosyltransferase family 4 protein [Clostridia bacterium]
MKNLLFVTNIAGSKMKVDFCKGAMNAAKKNNLKFLSVANRSASTPEQIKIDEQEYGVFLRHADISRSPFSKSNITAYKQIVKLINDENIDYIHCNTPVGGLIGRLAGKKCKVKKVIYQAHGFHFYKGAPLFNRTVLKWAEKLMAHYTDAIITMNKEDYEAAKKFKLRGDGKVYLVHGVGIDLSLYENIEVDRAEKRAELGLKDTDVAFISMGDLIARKNYSVAIKALAKAGNENAHYFICGRGPLENELKELAKTCGVENRVHFLGFRTDIKELLVAADAFLFTTLQEGLPRSMMEAMASGLPCIVSKIRGNVDLIIDGEGGFLCPPTSADVFAKAIDNFCNNFELREKMGAFNLDYVKKFDVSVVEKEIEKIYKEVF